MLLMRRGLMVVAPLGNSIPSRNAGSTGGVRLNPVLAEPKSGLRLLQIPDGSRRAVHPAGPNVYWKCWTW